MSDPRERVDDHAPLRRELGGVGDVLPRAAAAHAEVGARGLDAVGRGLDDADGLRPDESPVVLGHLGLDGVARDRAAHEGGAAVVEVRDGVAAVC